MERVEPLLVPPIDELFESFARALPSDLAEVARALPVTLRLAPSREVPWSEVFSHEITLGAPRLAGEAMPGVPAAALADACIAHLLAIVEAFGTDRVLDGQVARDARLDAVLAEARRARDAALARVTADAEPGFTEAEARTEAAIRAEQEALSSAVTWPRYLAIAYDKQRLGLPASLALARAAGWDAARRRALGRLLDVVWVALQLHDDVIDWEDDLTRGGAWAASLAGVTGTRDAASARPVILASGVLARMLSASARRFRAARRLAAALGMDRLSTWARGREQTLAELARREAASPGHANRAHALSQWAKLVIPGGP